MSQAEQPDSTHRDLKAVQIEIEKPWVMTDLAARINVIGHVHEALEIEQAGYAKDSEEFVARNAAIGWLLAEQLALKALILATQPITMADATIAMAALFELVSWVTDGDLEHQLKTGSLVRDLATAKRVSAGILAVLARFADIDLDTIGEPGLEGRIDSLYPNFSPKGETA